MSSAECEGRLELQTNFGKELAENSKGKILIVANTFHLDFF